MHATAPGPEVPRPNDIDLELTPLLNGSTPYTVRFVYTAASPWLVLLRCKNPDGWCEWVLSRDLLAFGMATDTGEGDVHVVPDGDHVWITFSSPSGWAALCFPRGQLERALDATESLVPPGTEDAHTDWDTAFAALANPA